MRIGHSIGGDVVMRRADAAAGEQQVIGAAQRLVEGTDGGDDLGVVVGHDADLAQVETGGAQHAGQMMGITLARAAGQDFVPDDKDGGGGIVGLHGTLLAVLFGSGKGIGVPAGLEQVALRVYLCIQAKMRTR